ncbi:MAG TPA: DUF1259 domain-containing protein [Armatimonadota bacterium]|jgi:hypothetical protein
MKKHAIIVLTAVSLGWPGLAQDVPAMPKGYADAMSIVGKTGDFKDNVLKLSVPRSDLKVTVDGVETPTAFGFGGWIAMTKGDGGKDVMMGDLVLLQDEVNPVMSALLDNGLEVTALHNHFFWEQPRIFYMHVHGYGTASDLARRVKAALDLIGKIKVREAQSAERSAPGGAVAGTIDTAKIDRIVGHNGDRNGAVYKITIGRSDLNVKEMGATINSRMGLNTWAAFFGSDDNAVVAGDVAMLENEVTPVLKALRKNDLNVVAIHHHMIGARPMIIFLHYWGKGTTEKLATGIRAVLSEIGKPVGQAGGMPMGGDANPGQASETGKL